MLKKKTHTNDTNVKKKAKGGPEDHGETPRYETTQNEHGAPRPPDVTLGNPSKRIREKNTPILADLVLEVTTNWKQGRDLALRVGVAFTTEHQSRAMASNLLAMASNLEAVQKRRKVSSRIVTIVLDPLHHQIPEAQSGESQCASRGKSHFGCSRMASSG